eukprot:177830-Rhodomonas_salina.1
MAHDDPADGRVQEWTREGGAADPLGKARRVRQKYGEQKEDAGLRSTPDAATCTLISLSQMPDFIIIIYQNMRP